MYYETTFEEGYMTGDCWDLFNSFGFIRDEEDGTGYQATVFEIAEFMGWSQLKAYMVCTRMKQAKYVKLEPTEPRNALITLT